MKNEILLTIKETLEDAQDITVLSMNVIDNVVFGVYISEVRDNLSFLSLPKKHFETTIDGINIQFFELGAVLHNIYFNGALKFIDILYPDIDIIEANSYYITLCDFVVDNIPFNIAKLKYIEAVSKEFDYGTDTEQVSMLMDVALELDTNLVTWYGKHMDNFLYVKDVETENDFIKAYNSLNGFKQWLQNEKFTKISQNNMSRIDEMYINIQLLHMRT